MQGNSLHSAPSDSRTTDTHPDTHQGGPGGTLNNRHTQPTTELEARDKTEDAATGTPLSWAGTRA